jgi:hypothetical protein
LRCTRPRSLNGPEHVVWHLERHAEDVLGGKRVVAGELKVVERALAVGEERVAAHADEQPARTSFDRLRLLVEADRHAVDQHLAGGLGLPCLASCCAIDGSGLRTVVRRGKHE